jgi:hypothetical protein
MSRGLPHWLDAQRHQKLRPLRSRRNPICKALHSRLAWAYQTMRSAFRASAGHACYQRPAQTSLRQRSVDEMRALTEFPAAAAAVDRARMPLVPSRIIARGRWRRGAGLINMRGVR